MATYLVGGTINTTMTDWVTKWSTLIANSNERLLTVQTNVVIANTSVTSPTVRATTLLDARQSLRLGSQTIANTATIWTSASLPLATSSTDNALVRFDGTSGATQNSLVTVADDGSMAIAGSSSGAMLRITQTGSGVALLVEDSASTDSTPFVVDTSGNVGIGVTPAAPLDVLISTNNRLKVDAATHGSLTGTSIGLRFSRGSDGVADVAAIFGWNNGGLAVAGREGIVFATGGGALWNATTEAMRLTDAGLLGIGTPSPSGRLDVQDNTGSLSSSQNITLEVHRADGTYNPRLQIRHSTTGSDINHTYSSTAAALTFSIADTEAVRIDTNRNVGIGITPTAATRLHAYNSATTGTFKFETIHTSSSDHQLLFGSVYSANWYGPELRYQISGGGSPQAATLSYMSGGTRYKAFEWFDTYAAIFAGNNEKLRVDATGVGIGKSASTALDVNGTVTATQFAGGGAALTGVEWLGASYTISTSTPSGGTDGDFWFEREA